MDMNDTCPLCGGTGEVKTDEGIFRFRIDPPEPPCSDTDGHDWHTGIKEPYGKGDKAGVVEEQACAHCSAYRVTDTWAQAPKTGEQRIRGISYYDADEYSLRWVELRRENPSLKFYDTPPI